MAALAACLTGGAVFALGRPDHIGPVALVVESAAMAPAIPAGTTVLVDRDAYRDGRRPALGDIVAVPPTDVIRAACGSTGYPMPPVVLRVAGVPGDRVSVRGGLLHHGRTRVPVTGERRDTPRYDRNFGAVPPGTVLLLGDNRPSSCDARLWVEAGSPFIADGLLLGRVPDPGGGVRRSGSARPAR